MTRARPSMSENVRWGVRFGLLLSGLLIAFVSIGYLVRPNSPIHQQFGWFQVAGAYLVSGVVCGLVVGLCRPLITSLFRSILIGPIVAFPFYAIVWISNGDPFWRWDSVFWTISIITVVILGTILGGVYWLIFSGARR